MSRTYTFRTCWVCHKQHSSNGLATVNHMRKHVREGKLIEMKDRDGFVQFEAIKPKTSEPLMRALNALLKM